MTQIQPPLIGTTSTDANRASSNPPNLSALILKNQMCLHQPTSILCAFSCLISESGDKCIAIAAEASDLAENPGAEILLLTTGSTAQETGNWCADFGSAWASSRNSSRTKRASALK